VILLLSIVVTTMVQVSQAFLRLRSRNLMIGLAALIANARKGSGPAATNISRADRSKAKKDATTVMNADNVALMNRVDNPTSWFRYWILGPKVSWIKADELKDALISSNVGIESQLAERIAADFRKSEVHLQKRFLKMTRGWSVFWALIVAISFQVSAPTLFNELSRDNERRARIVADTDQLLVYGAEAYTQSGFDLVAPDALDALADANPNYADLIEQASGVGTTRAFIVDELELALEGLGADDRDRLVAEYDNLLDKKAREQLEATRERVGHALGQLAQYDIELWPRGWKYYFGETGEPWNYGAIVGVIITAILLSFGGSFWFEQLRNLLALRDTMAGLPQKKAGTAEKGQTLNINVAAADKQDAKEERAASTDESQNRGRD
jgi:hypothetical protein